MPLVLQSSSFNSSFPMSLSYELLELNFKSLVRLDPPFIPDLQKLEVDYISQLEIDYIFISPTCKSYQLFKIFLVNKSCHFRNINQVPTLLSFN